MLERYNFEDDHGHPLENCKEYIELLAELTTLRTRVELYRKALEEIANNNLEGECCKDIAITALGGGEG